MSLDASVMPSEIYTELCTQFEHRFVPCVPAWLLHTKKLTQLLHFAVAYFQLVAACQMSLLYTAMYPRSNVKRVSDPVTVLFCRLSFSKSICVSHGVRHHGALLSHAIKQAFYVCLQVWVCAMYLKSSMKPLSDYIRQY